MMNQIALLIALSFSFTSSGFAADATPKPKYGPTATRLFQSNDYVRKNKAPDFWALISYYLPQYTGASCSLASVTMVLNAARAHQALTASDELATEKNVLKKQPNDHWFKAVGEKGGGGANLDQAKTYLEDALKSFGISATVEAIHSDGAEATKKLIHARLKENEKSDHDFIIANFLQSEFTGDPEGAIGHLAPVAAYDEKNKKVLIMDPDREYYEPYWVSEDTFMKGISTQDSGTKLFRGLLYVKLK